MNGKKIVGDGSKATLPGGKKMDDYKKSPSYNSTTKTNGMAGSGSQNQSEQTEEKQKSKGEQVAQAASSEALKKGLKAAFPVVPQFVINKLVDSNLGQAVIEQQLQKFKRKMMLYVAGAVVGIVGSILGICVIVAVIASPVAAIADALNSIGDFFASMGNWLGGKGWCSGEECQQNAEAKYYDKLTNAVEKYSGSCEINEDLITATIFYGQMTKEEEMEYDNEETPDTDNYFNYFDVKEGTGSPTAVSQINKLIRVYLKGEKVDLDSDEAADLEITDGDTCSASAESYRQYLIDTYIDWAYPSVTENKTKEEVADEIMTMAEINRSNTGITIVDNTDGLFTMLPGGLSLRKTSDPANCRCHPTKKIYQSHKGVDIGGAPYGTEILALEDGVVDQITIATKVTCGSSIIKLKHVDTNGEIYYTRYVHLNRASNSLLKTYKVGDTVKKGQIIGYVGGTTTEDSCSTGPHLHFEIHNSEAKPINPLVALNNYNNGVPVLSNQELINVCLANGRAC